MTDGPLVRYLHKSPRLQNLTCDSASTLLQNPPAPPRVRARSHGRRTSMAASAAAHLPLRASMRVGAAPSRPSAAAVAGLRGRPERRGLAAAPRGGRGLGGVRTEAVSGGDGGGGGGLREPMVPPYNVLITGSTKGWQLGYCDFSLLPGRFCISEFMLIFSDNACNLNTNR